MNIDQNSLMTQFVERTLGMPPGGPKAVPINLDFAAFTTYTLDLSAIQQDGRFNMCQTLWVDNRLSATTLTITIPGSQQTLVIPIGVQGYFPVICPNPIRMTFTSAGAVVVQVTLMNYPVFT